MNVAYSYHQFFEKGNRTMGCGRWIIAILLPPLAVIDKGIGPILVVTMLTILGWIPGIIGAYVFVAMGPKRR